MDNARYFFGVLLVTFLPPGLLWWFLVHPFIDFWRRIGVRGTLIAMAVMSLASVAALMTVRDRLLLADLGTHVIPTVLAAVLVTIAIWLAIQRKRHLTFRILAGLPELETDFKGRLLTEGIYGIIRHPRYVEIALGTLGYAAFANYQGAYLMAIATVPLLHLIVLLEEKELIERFGDEYLTYRSLVPRYMPRRKSSTD